MAMRQELLAFEREHGHCNVPEVYPENQELGMWVKRQRVTRAAGQLSQERLTILERMGFEFGDLAQVTEEWETRFDMLVDWVLIRSGKDLDRVAAQLRSARQPFITRSKVPLPLRVTR